MSHGEQIKSRKERITLPKERINPERANNLSKRANKTPERANNPSEGANKSSERANPPMRRANKSREKRISRSGNQRIIL